VILADLIADKVVVVTGSSRGLGAGLAAAYLSAGARLGLCARSATPSHDPRVVSAALDVADEAAVERFAGEVTTRLGPIDLWINNAGLLAPIGPLAEIDGAALRQHLETNVVGVWAGSRAYLRQRRSSGGGVLVNVSSGAARKAYAGWSAYCAGKAAVDRMSECNAVEEPWLRVHAVAPGVIDTDMQALIRSTPAARFPAVDRFVKMKAEGSFSTPGWVAARLAELVFDPGHRTSDVLVSLPLEHPL
jgi:NAD(P)-dependent dehydrogenase (short-subunit alcohol dehydrogenase family)